MTGEWACWERQDRARALPKLASDLVELVKSKQADFTFPLSPPPHPARPPPAKLARGHATPMKLGLGAAAGA
eukprot:SAG11_NODE_14733_length_601_cov_1.908367_1_plen_71_part_10